MPDQLDHCGFITLLGRPNVGKSTLLNRILGQKLSITSRKPQTTRSRILGIKSLPGSQSIFIDTPGIQSSPSGLFNRYMSGELDTALHDVDIIVHVTEALKWTGLDKLAWKRIEKVDSTRILVINKIDKVQDKKQLLPFIQDIETLDTYSHIVPISAKTGTGIESLELLLTNELPPGVALFPEDQVTDKNERYLAAEFIREKLTRYLGEEVPYNLTVTIDKYQDTKRIVRIFATIWVSSEGQRRIVIGKNGAVLKKSGELARRDLEFLLGKKVFVQTWVKIMKKWTHDNRALKQFGYTN